MIKKAKLIQKLIFTVLVHRWFSRIAAAAAYMTGAQNALCGTTCVHTHNKKLFKNWFYENSQQSYSAFSGRGNQSICPVVSDYSDSFSDSEFKNCWHICRYFKLIFVDPSTIQTMH